ncbi:hypothetical protein glysoja_001371 [Glycine soja]|nr:hypothetical protein JHK87_037619 [Glycine soja]KHN36640.1 hypothetical protein glysoja_001371 [Glycine soja]
MDQWASAAHDMSGPLTGVGGSTRRSLNLTSVYARAGEAGAVELAEAHRHHCLRNGLVGWGCVCLIGIGIEREEDIEVNRIEKEVASWRDKLALQWVAEIWALAPD